MGCAVLVWAALATPGAARDGQDGGGLLRLRCVGTMVTGTAPASKVQADGFVDLIGMRVRGFGLGSAPILRVSDALVDFGTPAGGRAAGPSVHGTIDRRTGLTLIEVHAASDPTVRLIAMELACTLAPVGS